MSAPTITAQELKATLQSGKAPLLVDVRTAAEYRECHVQSAINLPLDQLSESSIQKIAPKEAEIYLICKSGTRSEMAKKTLSQLGYGKLTCIAGGTDECIANGLPLVRGKKVMSLERQVRLVAGSLIVLGMVLGFFVNPAFFVLPTFIGCGFVFSALTDTCGMGMILAKAPWNR